MTKINIAKPTGSEELSLISAFKSENTTYIILDSEKVGSMGLPIIYISKLNGKLEKIIDDNEWQNIKNCLKGIINGTNFEYVKIDSSLNADEAYYTPLTLPQTSFDLIKSRYVVEDDKADTSNANPPEEILENTFISSQSTMDNLEVDPILNRDIVTPVKEDTNAQTTINPQINIETNKTETAMPIPVPKENVEPSPVMNNAEVSILQTSTTNTATFDTNIFEQDKETFLKACENMFDALVSKYQKELNNLEAREQNLKLKEQEIVAKLNSASETLANAEAKEQIANIAHDNAQKVMDISNLMPNNPIAN